MRVIWTFALTLQLVLHNILGQHFTTEENWRPECLQHFYSTIKMKSIGIFYKDDMSSLHNSVLTSIANKGISSAVLELPVQDHQILTRAIIKWKSVGIYHILFLQRMDEELLHLWLQILNELCDETWWLFYAEEALRSQFESILSASECFTGRWMVFSTNFSTCQNSVINGDWYMKMIQNPPKTFYSAKVNMSENSDSSWKIIKLAVNESPPYLTLEAEDGKIILSKGPDAELLRTLAAKFHFKYTIKRPSDGEWGRIKEGNWTGLIGMLSRGEADIATGCVTITLQRYEAAAYSFPYDVQKSVIITRIPDLKPMTYAVLLPFTNGLWMMVLFVLLSFLFLVYVVGRIYGTLYSRKYYKFDRIFLYLIGSICSEGGWLTFVVQGPTAVLLLTLWLLFVLVMQAIYCGTLMSVLGFPPSEPAIDTLSDLARAITEKGYTCGCLKGTINCDDMLGLKGDLEVIATSLKSNDDDFVHSVEEGLKKVLEENYAFIAQEIGSIYRAQLMPDPNFYMSDDGLHLELFSLAIRKGLPYLKDINKVILRLSEAGLISKWRDDITSLNDMKFATRKYEVLLINPLSLKELAGVVYMCSYGLGLAVVAFMFECINGKLLNKHN